jgi:hypothetical protein
MVSARHAARALFACAMSGLGGVGCATILGGLDEGTSATVSTDAGSDAPAIGEAAAGEACSSWLTGFRYRLPVVVKHAGPAVRAYQVKLTLSTAALVASGKLRADGADVRVTAADGVSVVPHWTQGGVGTDATTIWTSLDVASGETPAYLYYGNAEASDESAMAKTFVPAVLDDPTFDREGTWFAFHDGADEQPTSRTNEWSVALAHDSATIRLVRNSNPNGARAGICQTALFPAGSSYRLLFDVNVRLADRGAAVVSLDGLGGDVLWATQPSIIGVHSGADTWRAISPGPHVVCLAVGTEASNVGQGAEATYSALRARRFVAPEPAFDLSAPEQEACR